MNRKSSEAKMKSNIMASVAGALSGVLVITLIGFFSARAIGKGSMALVKEKRADSAAVSEASQELSGDAAGEADAGSDAGEEIAEFYEERIPVDEPAQTEELEPEPEPEVKFNVQPVSEIVLNEAIHIEDRHESDPFFNTGLGTDDVNTWQGDIPAIYDANEREAGDVITEVRNQGGSRLCWAYAGLGAVEANLLMKHPTLGADKLDLSEKHLAYYVLSPSVGSLGGLIDGDYRQVDGIGDDASQNFFQSGLSYVMNGGVTDSIYSALAAWKGPVDDTGPDSFERQRNGKILLSSQEYPSDPYDVPYHVQGIYEISGKPYNRDAVKKMILTYGAVTCSVHANQAPDDNYWYLSGLYDGDPYGENDNLADHEVLVVGWDDDYETDNFKPEPLNPGAWLCRNSWGATAGDGGYFHLSYDDVIFQNNNVAAYNVALEGDEDFYDRNYQVATILTHIIDMMVDWNNVVYALSESMNPYGVMYTAEGGESLKAVGLFALETENSYDIEIYLNPEMADDGGIKASALTEPNVKQTVYSASGGYHTYKLTEALPLSAGDRFLVLIKPALDSKLVYEKAMTSTGDANYDDDDKTYLGNVTTVTQASGLSFYVNEDGTEIVPQKDKDFFVKAFTKLD